MDTAPAGTTSAPRLPVWLRVLLPMLLFLPAAMTSILPALIPGIDAASRNDDWSGVAAYALICAAPLLAYLLVAWLLMRGIDRRPFSALGLGIGPRAALALLVGTAVSVASLATAGLVARISGIDGSMSTVDVAQVMPPGTSASVLLLFVLLRAFVLQGIGEELLFRGYVLQTLSRRPRLAVLITACAFTLPHLASSGGQQSFGQRLVYLALPFGFALSAGVLAIALRTVWAGVGVHGGFHVAIAFGPMLGIAADGPALWAMIGAIHVLAALVIGLLIPRRRWHEVRERGPYARAGAILGT